MPIDLVHNNNFGFYKLRIRHCFTGDTSFHKTIKKFPFPDLSKACGVCGDRPCGQADLCSTRLAIQDISRVYKPCFTMSTSGALESIRPPHFPQVLCTRFFSGKFFLKFKQATLSVPFCHGN